ncbi:MAG: Lacal_2735 family protein [Saprospiraceae bacterium]|nr:Lacal_2735 family protein [Saprospiraceae bacterium]MBK8373250.1 Lacal_2735 family protein [Saprospiraceae bacterium]MBK8545903.1 Lacal_2735 family protein [Saprospiraceae bacterium]MBK8819681.1 Lacal_2735 family protein [Saprospiraceae bacterium]MBK8852517.1 Lacal_2735 family protein [Saprospiraceae bacterium]
MFGLFKKKSQIEVLMEKYKKLMEESFRLSKSDRKAADAKLLEAEEMMKEIENLSAGKE